MSIDHREPRGPRRAGSAWSAFTRFCVHPADVVRSVPKVGGTKTPNLEKIASLAPDLIFMNREENREEDHDWLAARFPVDLSMPSSPADVPPVLRRWGFLLDLPGPAEHWASAIDLELGAATSRTAARFLVLIWRGPFMAVGTETYVHELFAVAGGDNVVRTPRYPEIDLAHFAAEEALYLVLPDEPYPFEVRHLDELRPEVPRSTPILVRGDDLTWHGVRTVRGLRLARAILSGACSEARAGGAPMACRRRDNRIMNERHQGSISDRGTH
ncbi:MAG: ABC transporter substrate-binding protein, partial [Myxococcales bacterium]|nr:ABC transporter substrate-binding protein [Myxococcales bacterium]